MILLIAFVFAGALVIYTKDRQERSLEKLPEQSSSLPSAKWYVSTKGNDRNTGTAPGQAFATIQKAVDMAQPGEAIRLEDGTYKQSFHSARDASQKKPITIMGTRKAVVSGSRPRTIEINHDYIRMTGFTVDGHHGSGDTEKDYRDKLIYAIGTEPKNGVEGLKIDHMMLKNAGGECVRLRYFAKYNEITNTTIKDCGIFDFRFDGGGKNGEGIYIGTAPEQLDDGKNPDASPDESTDNWIHNNYIETNGNECVDVKEAAHDNLIERNECTKQLDPESGGMDARGDRNTFRYNTIYDNVGAGVRLGGDSDEDGIENNVYKNIIRDNEGYALKIQRGPQGKVCDNKFSENKEGVLGGDYGEEMTVERTCET